MMVFEGAPSLLSGIHEGRQRLQHPVLYLKSVACSFLAIHSRWMQGLQPKDYHKRFSGLGSLYFYPLVIFRILFVKIRSWKETGVQNQL